MVELFNDGCPTGKIAYIQIKGTNKRIEALKKGKLKRKAVSCPKVSDSTFAYAQQKRIPIILIFASLAEPQCFYYVDLQSQIDDIEERKTKPGKTEHTVHIPIENYVENDLTGFFGLINSFYD